MADRILQLEKALSKSEKETVKVIETAALDTIKECYKEEAPKKVFEYRSRVADDAVWYDTVKLELESPYEDLALNYGMMHEPVYVGDYLFVLVTGEKRFNYDEALSDPDFDFNDYVINSVLKYDLEGTLVEEIDFDYLELNVIEE